MRLLSGEVALPALVVKERELSNNLAVMAAYANEQGFSLAPHGKTTMAPAIFERQLAAGAWGMTVASMAQAAVAYQAGAHRVLVANEVVGEADAVAAVRLTAAPGRELYCLVDSVAGARLLDGRLARAGATKDVAVLVELGAAGGRAGARTEEEAVAVAQEVSTCAHLDLVGVEGFEGVLADDRSAEALAKVDAYLLSLGRLAARLAGLGHFRFPGQPIVSAGGSKYFDRAAALLGANAPGDGLSGGHRARLVVRSGCYAVHDHGVYARTSPLAGPGAGKRYLRPAVEIWAEVLSVPEARLAIVSLGKRDAPYDLGLPVPTGLARLGQEAVVPLRGAHLRELNDQHGYLVLSEPGQVTVGDRVSFGISHPCTAFDKWRTVFMVDEAYGVLSTIETFFH